eukprot:CAMPEP_0177780678 /NCGR_PEP_ID=MMETSP0491_2-20121128/17370_1 /TAXON_ID=63592 /ORGANISM="Tetraselmis chuii, Strain PLY429" /LENGTH=615 /DNA_ID=CAMNT_0019300543 /DNA_START=266 /DNA_END=2113 /DNA_ORIENTATION=+
MIVESRPMLNLGRKNTGPNPFLDDATSPEDLEWLEEYGDKATAEILAVGRQLDGITSDMLLRLAGVRVGENHSLNSRLEGVRKLFREKSRGKQSEPLSVDAVCEDAMEKQTSPLAGMDWLMALTADLIRLEVVDVHGCSRGLTVGVEKFLSTGMDGLGIRISYANPTPANKSGTQSPLSLSSRSLNDGSGSDKAGSTTSSGPACCALPVARDPTVAGDAPLVTFLPWTSRAKHERVVSVLCETKCVGQGREWQAANPRHIARRQLQHLHSAGFLLRSSFQPTFVVMDGKQWPRRLVAEEVTQLSEELAASGIPCDELVVSREDNDRSSDDVTVHAVLREQRGLDAADAAFRLRNGVREFFTLQDDRRAATFMTQPFADQPASFMHFQHSIAALDASSSPANTGRDKPRTSEAAASSPVAAAVDSISSDERHWLAGLQRHAPALAALGAPTVNCYQKVVLTGSKTRCLTTLCPVTESDTPTVTIGTRSAADSDDCAACFENRHCRAPANPYLILAATVASGLDGLSRQLEPAEGEAAGCALMGAPTNLAEALESLEADDVISGALGPALMAWFREVKDTELCLLGDETGSSSSTPLTAASTDSALAVQRQVYTNFM